MALKDNLVHLRETDSAIYEAICLEIEREEHTIELIASENFTSLAIMEAQGSVLTNKYAEGYPSRRYYGGCDYVDIVESLAKERAKNLFSAEHVNVQPHSGSQANMAVYLSVLQPGDLIMGMNLSDGGHLTHGSPVNFSGKIFKSISYGVDKNTGLLDYALIEEMAVKHKPRMIVAGASSYSRTIDFEKFAHIASKVGAYLFADIAHIAGLVVCGLHPDPVPHCDFVTTTTHKTLRGPRGGIILCREKFQKAIDKIIFPGIQGGPLMHVIAGKAVCFKEAGTDSFRQYQKQVIQNASVLSKALIKHGFQLVSGGTDNHLMLIHLQGENLSGKRAEELLGEIGITVNKNTVPGEKRSPFVTSGLRIGVPAVTSRGMRDAEMIQISDFINNILNGDCNADQKKKLAYDVKHLCQQFPIYEGIDE